MGETPNLGDLQQMAMLAVGRLGDDAYGRTIRSELARVAGRKLSVSAIYVTLVRLEEQGMVVSEKTPPEPGAGGRGRRRFQVTPEGWEALRATRGAMDRLWDGLEPSI
jgi:DNA-binding PadR family transcriptional regulator